MADEATPTSEQAEAPAPDATPTDITPNAEALGDAGKAALVEERKARRDAERQLKALQGQLKALEDANKTEAQKATDEAAKARQEADQLRARLQGLAIRSAVSDAATKARAIDVDAVHALIRDDITVDDDGNPQGVDKAITALAKAKPFLFHTTPAGTRDVSAGNTYPLNDHDALTNAVLGAVGATR